MPHSTYEIIANTALGRHPGDSQNRSVRSGSRTMRGRAGWHGSRPPGYEYGQEHSHTWPVKSVPGRVGRRRLPRHLKRAVARGQVFGMVLNNEGYIQPAPARYNSGIYGPTLPPRGYAGKACCKSCEDGGSCEGCDGKGGCGKDCGCKG